MDLPLDAKLKIGVTVHVPTPGDVRRLAPRAESLALDSVAHGDHLAFTVPMCDPLIELASAAMLTKRIDVYTAVYLLPLRHPAAVAKQVASLDHVAQGRLIFGVGIGGEFPAEFAPVR